MPGRSYVRLLSFSHCYARGRLWVSARDRKRQKAIEQQAASRTGRTGRSPILPANPLSTMTVICFGGCIEPSTIHGFSLPLVYPPSRATVDSTGRARTPELTGRANRDRGGEGTALSRDSRSLHCLTALHMMPSNCQTVYKVDENKNTNAGYLSIGR